MGHPWADAHMWVSLGVPYQKDMQGGQLFADTYMVQPRADMSHCRMTLTWVMLPVTSTWVSCGIKSASLGCLGVLLGVVPFRK